MAALPPESGADVGTDSAAGPSLRPGGGGALPKPPTAHVGPEPTGDVGPHDAPEVDPRDADALTAAHNAPEPPTGGEDDPGDNPPESEGDSIHLEDDRI